MGILHFASASHTPTRSRATGHMHPGNASKWFREPSEKHLYQRATVKNPEDKSSFQNNVPPTAPYGAARRYCTLIRLGTFQHAPMPPAARSRAMHPRGVASHQVRNPREKHLYLRLRTLKISLLGKITPPPDWSVRCRTEILHFESAWQPPTRSRPTVRTLPRNASKWFRGPPSPKS